MIILICVMIILLLGIGTIMLVSNKVNKIDKTNDNTKISANEENEIETEEFSFIFNFNKISEEWWNSPNEYWKDLGYTNRKVYENRAENSFGNANGKLYVRPVDFTEYLRIGSEYYVLNVENNNFLIPEQIKIIDYVIHNVSSELNFYVLGTDLFFYDVKLAIDNNPSNIELDNGNWKIVSSEANGYINYDAYYPIDTDYCLHLKFPTAILEETFKNMDENTRDYYKKEYPYGEDDVKKLVDNTVPLISLNKTQGTTIDKLTFNVKLDDIKLDNNTTVHMSNMEMVSWHSGASNVVGKIFEKDSVISMYNKSGKKVNITEYSTDKDLDSYLSYLHISMKEYNYNGRKFYINYYNENALEQFKGKYIGIMFKIDDIWYEIDEGEEVDPLTDVDAWIKNMCDGVISFE